MSSIDSQQLTPHDSPSIEMSTLSALSLSQSFSTSWTTEAAIANMHRVEQAFTHAGLSLNASVFCGNVFDHNKMIAELDRKGIKTGSIDLPFVIPVLEMIKESTRDLIGGDIITAAKSAIFSLLNVQNNEQFYNILESLKDGVPVLRANSGFFIHERQGQGITLEHMLSKNPTWQISLEQDGRYHTWSDFISIFERLSSRFPGRVSISFDPGQIMRAHKYLPSNQQEDPGNLITDLLKDGNIKLISGVEYNTHYEGERVDYDAILKTYAQAHKVNKLGYPVKIILEPTPGKDFARYTNSNNPEICRLKDAFDRFES